MKKLLVMVCASLMILCLPGCSSETANQKTEEKLREEIRAELEAEKASRGLSHRRTIEKNLVIHEKHLRKQTTLI